MTQINNLKLERIGKDEHYFLIMYLEKHKKTYN